MELEEFNRHFSDEITKKIKLFARRALLSACYDCLIVEDKENKKRAFCTHCKKWVEIPEDNRHTGSPQYIRKCKYNGDQFAGSEPGKIQTCPSCRKSYNVYHAWRLDLSQLNAAISISIWQKSRIDKQAITMRRIEVNRSFSTKAIVQDTFVEMERYLFRMGEKTLRTKKIIYFHPLPESKYRAVEGGFVKSIKDRAAYNFPFSRMDPLAGEYFMDMTGFDHAIANTPFQYCSYKLVELSGYQQRHGFNQGYPEFLVQYLDLYSAKPWVEILIKNRLSELVAEKVRGKGFPNVIDWRATSIGRAVRRFTKQDLQEIRELNEKKYNYEIVDSEKLSFLLLARKKLFPDLTVNDVIEISEGCSMYGLSCNLKKLNLKMTVSFSKFKAYCAKQEKLIKQPSKLLSMYLGDWLDYLRDAEKSKLDLQDLRNLWPKDLITTHANVLKQMQIEKNRHLNEQIIALLPQRQELFSFASKKYRIRPAESVAELVAEGKKLHHCVGSYAKEYAEGSTNILFLRKSESPDASFVTMEVVKDEYAQYHLVQIRANMNADPSEDVKKFAQHFIKVVNDRAKETKVRVRIA